RPGVDGEGIEIRNEVHVGLFDPSEPLDRGTVELNLAVERLDELRARQFDVLDDAEDVGELQPHEADVLRFAHLENFRLGKTRTRRVELQDLRFCHAASVFLTLKQDFSVNLTEIKIEFAKWHSKVA